MSWCLEHDCPGSLCEEYRHADDLRRRINEAEAAYRRGKPIISDAEFDVLVDEFADLEASK